MDCPTWFCCEILSLRSMGYIRTESAPKSESCKDPRRTPFCQSFQLIFSQFSYSYLLPFKREYFGIELNVQQMPFSVLSGRNKREQLYTLLPKKHSENVSSHDCDICKQKIMVNANLSKML